MEETACRSVQSIIGATATRRGLSLLASAICIRGLLNVVLGEFLPDFTQNPARENVGQRDRG